MKGKYLFYTLCLAVALLSSCGSDPKLSPITADLDCDTCLFMISKKDGNYELRRIDVAKSDETLVTEPPTPGRYHVLRFHPNDALTKEMWWTLWGGPRTTATRPSPLDSDFIQFSENITADKISSAKPDGKQDIAIGYLDQVPLDSVPDHDTKNDTLK
ncbi:MAG: hypothetical protein JWO03_2505 [Bacteroidetes bacterium]|nr:hypothetical protein [Bacteroidota bacterium]